MMQIQANCLWATKGSQSQVLLSAGEQSDWPDWCWRHSTSATNSNGGPWTCSDSVYSHAPWSEPRNCKRNSQGVALWQQVRVTSSVARRFGNDGWCAWAGSHWRQHALIQWFSIYEISGLPADFMGPSGSEFMLMHGQTDTSGHNFPENDRHDSRCKPIPITIGMYYLVPPVVQRFVSWVVLIAWCPECLELMMGCHGCAGLGRSLKATLIMFAFLHSTARAMTILYCSDSCSSQDSLVPTDVVLSVVSGTELEAVSPPTSAGGDTIFQYSQTDKCCLNTNGVWSPLGPFHCWLRCYSWHSTVQLFNRQLGATIYGNTILFGSEQKRSTLPTN